MAGMGFMIAAASRPRDERGRYAEGDEGRRMGNDHSTHMGGYDRMEAPEMRRRRDSRGRYMEDEGGSRIAYEGNQSRMEYGNESAYRPWPEPHIPPYLDNEKRMNDTMRDRNIVNIRDYQDKRRIGFGMNRMDGEEDMDMRHYGRRFNPDRMSMGRSEHQPQMMGGSEGEDDEHLSREDAEKWVKGMKSEDGKTGGRWPLNEIKQYAGNFGVHGDEVVEFFAVMNALYTDYCKVAKKYGVDKVDFWADLAKAFMHDKDAGEGKVKKYYECIAKHDDD